MKKTTVNINFSVVVYTVLFLLGLYLAFVLKGVLFILFFAFIINAAVRPVINSLQKYGFPRWLAMLLVYLVVIILILLLSLIIFTEAFNQFRLFVTSITENPASISKGISDNFPFLKNFIDVDKFLSNFKLVLTGGQDINQIDTTQVFQFIVQAINVVGTPGLSVVEGVVGGVFSLIIILVTSAYMAYPETNFHDQLLNLFPTKNTKRFSETLMKIQNSLGAWMGGQIILMLAIGLLSYFVFLIPAIFDPNYQLFKFALILGIIAGLLEVLPNIGPVLTIIISMLIAIISGASLPVLIYVLVMLFLLQELEAWVIVPVVMKKAIDLHPVLSILAIIIGFELGGPIAALLSIPIVGALQIVVLELSDEWKIAQAKKEDKPIPTAELSAPVRKDSAFVKLIKDILK